MWATVEWLYCSVGTNEKTWLYRRLYLLSFTHPSPGFDREIHDTTKLEEKGL